HDSEKACPGVDPRWLPVSNKIMLKAVLPRSSFDGSHVGIRQSEMMTDLVHQHMLDDRAERFVMLGPVIEDRAAIQPDHVGHLHRRAFDTERQTDALEQTEQIELALRVHFIEHLIAREIIDLNDEVGAQVAKFARQMAKHLAGEDFELRERGCFYFSPGEWIGHSIGHLRMLAQTGSFRPSLDGGAV